MLEKFNQIKEKNEFYSAVAALTGREEATLRSKWFNQTQGFAVPKEFEQTVHHVLDNRLAYEKAVEDFKRKYNKK